MSGWSIINIEGLEVVMSNIIMSKFQYNNVVFLSLKIFFVLTNSAAPDEMLHGAAFHLGLHCLQKHPFRSTPFLTLVMLNIFMYYTPPQFLSC